MIYHGIEISQPKIGDFCRRRHIRKLSFFGSILRPDFGPDSDIDVLVEFQSGHVPGFLALFDIEQEISTLLGGRKVDLVTPKFLNPRFRQSVLAAAQVQYAQG